MGFHRTRCAHCKAKFTPERPSQIVHVECVEAWTEAQAAKRERAEAKAARAAAKVERAETRRRKEAMKRLPELIAEAQEAFNAYIRARDAGLPCICCGQPFEPMKPGGSVDAGHFRSRSSAGHLRFNEDNCFAQRKNCNRPGGTTYGAFRAGVVARIGEARVAALEADNAVRKWTHDEVREIRDTYRQKLKQLTKGTP
ncbi:recombination protein NinG [Acidovorax sp. MR-S7]|uniref:recombination protein NinG n=1 Tax=Acidovorax sp. MR-S7 TaxID=1268622 RepID=UPI00036B030B|nr:recombination protein NinG [Acidovorax sp. MR-S7]